jgi:hypothetical protein
MSVLSGNTTLVCLFQSKDHADAAIKDIVDAGVLRESIITINKENESATGDTFENIGVRGKEAQHLRDCLKDDGTVLVVAATGVQADEVERIFHKHEAVKVEDSDITKEGIATAPHDREVIEPLMTRIYRRMR